MRTAEKVRQIVSKALKRSFDLSIEIAIEYPPRTEFGDIATPVAFEVAKIVKQSPRAVAEKIVASVEKPPEIEKIELAGGGYINIFFDRSEYMRSLLSKIDLSPARDESKATKVIVEHTNINPNKAAHIGHLRNAVLGDTLSRILAFLGYSVEVQNYIDDTGVQVADLVIGFQHLLKIDIEKVRGIDGRFDHYCWDLYAQVTSHYEKSTESAALRDELRARTLEDIEKGNNPTAQLASHCAHRIVNHHLATMRRIGVGYDLLAWEGHILAMKFWEKALTLLKENRAISFCEEGKNKGCWVMNLPVISDSEVVDESEKIIVRSNGTVTYVGKDIAYQLWKFGLLGRDFFYMKWHSHENGTELWSTSAEAGEQSHPSFGNADRVYNVIDVRQSYLQRIVKEGLKLTGFPKEADNSIHFSYEMVALSPRCAMEMGFEISEEEKKKPYVEMSGRKGQGVKADDLLEKLFERALAEVRARNQDLDVETIQDVARKVASGALRYFMLKFTRNKVISFDFEDALNFDGETGPYIQYSVVRARNIFNKMKEREEFREEEIGRMSDSVNFDALEEQALRDHWEIVMIISQFEEIVGHAARTLELSAIAKYCFTLSQKFNSFYQKYPVMQEKSSEIKKLRILITHLFITHMSRALNLMGIEIPSRM